MKRNATPEMKTVIISPLELAELLGLDPDDAPFLSSAPVRLPADWPNEWRTRLGPLELTTAEAGMILGRTMRTVQDWIREHGLLGISPAALMTFLRRRVARKTPPIIETPTQQAKRAAAVRARVAALCGGKPVID